MTRSDDQPPAAPGEKATGGKAQLAPGSPSLAGKADAPPPAATDSEAHTGP